MDKTDKIDLILYAILGAILLVGGIICKILVKARKIYIWFLISIVAGCILLFLCVAGLCGGIKKADKTE